MTHPRRSFAALAPTALFAAVAAAALYLATQPIGYAADKSDPPKVVTGSLDFVPADAVAVISVRVADIWNHPAVKAVLEKQKDLPEPLREVSTRFGVHPEDVERVTIIEESARGPGQELVGVTMLKPYNRRAVLGAAAPDAKEKDVGARSFYDNPSGPSVCLIDDRTLLFGASEALQSYLKHAPAKEGPLASVLKLALEKHVVVAGIDAEAVAASAPKGGQVPEWLRPLLKARLATLTVDLDDQVRVSGRVTFAKESDAQEGAAGLNDALDLARGGFVQAAKELTRDDDAPKLAALLKDVQAALRAAKAEQKGTMVEVETSLKIDNGATTAALAEGVEKVQKAAKRMLISNDLKLLALSVHNYSDTFNGRMPAAAIYDKNGKPLLSWRVTILPYIEQFPLYNEFHLDEPWDSDHNKKLLEKMPTTFAPPDSQAFKDHETFLQAFVGKGTVFESPAAPKPGPAPNGLRLAADITDGTSNTILFVEAAKSVPWTKPEDIPFDSGKLLPKVGGLSKGGFMVALCDGSVRFFPLTIKEDNLRAWITRNGGEISEDPEK
jgi:Protein of unknown function (DUF1559)